MAEQAANAKHVADILCAGVRVDRLLRGPNAAVVVGRVEEQNLGLSQAEEAQIKQGWSTLEVRRNILPAATGCSCSSPSRLGLFFQPHRMA
uniref:Uncharacterized protein n=1 Tax=Oryza sativa subsp. japonica TaxID=39947 RepID=Q69KM3_ORYSJ|nr:hypothetical protein [Oryza sativa Japonica Group]BAD72458.1 hypothetical protein [Oryza sativa Japonica Group]